MMKARQFLVPVAALASGVIFTALAEGTTDNFFEAYAEIGAIGVLIIGGVSSVYTFLSVLDRMDTRHNDAQKQQETMHLKSSELIAKSQDKLSDAIDLLRQTQEADRTRTYTESVATRTMMDTLNSTVVANTSVLGGIIDALGDSHESVSTLEESVKQAIAKIDKIDEHIRGTKNEI